ncbi:hypothetical protein, partial [Dyella flagellata]|uniref:hypothetical protein n=1 Tax=Dyella flagellata TaxID=1867833 RepID=UPI00384AA109
MSNSLKVVCGSVDRGSGQLSRSTLFLALLQGSRTQGKLIAWVTCPHYQIDGVDDVGDRRFACAVFVAGSILSRASSALDLRMQKLVHL